MSWTEERVERLKQLWADGESCSAIACDLGGVTRNAVIGKLHRLGLGVRVAKRFHLGPEARKPRKPRAIVGMRIGATHLYPIAFAVPPIKPEPAPPPVPVVELVIPGAQHCSIYELTDQTCRWPIGTPGQPDFCFCGARPMAARPYCGPHARMAYQPVAEARSSRMTSA